MISGQDSGITGAAPAATDDPIDAVAREIGLDAVEIETRKAFLEFGPDDVAALATVHALTEADGDALSAGFHEYFLRFAELRPLLSDGAVIERLKRAQAAYFRSLSAGDYGADYVHDRLRVGIAHERIGLAPKWYIGAYRRFLASLVDLLSARLRDDPARFTAAWNAVLKIVCFDMGLALDTYAHASQRSILQYKNYLEQVIDGMPAGLIVVDRAGRILSMNGLMRDLLGIQDDALAAHPLLATLLQGDPLAEGMRATLESGVPRDGVAVVVDGHADGARHVEFNIRRTTQQDGTLLLLIGRDVTFQRQARLRLQESEEFFRLIFHQAAVGIALLSSEGRFLRVNPKLSHIVGYTEAELLQRHLHEITQADDVPAGRALIRRLVAGETDEDRRELRYVARDGHPVWVAASVSAMRVTSGGQLRLILIVEDISARKQAEDALVQMASHDALTGLPNRVMLQDRLAYAIAQAQRLGRDVAVLFIDLDRFKHVNDSLGHEAGDRLIVETARRLDEALRDSDTVARLGGDEFVVVLPDLAGPDDAAMVARKILEDLTRPLDIRGREIFPTGSIGIAMYPRDGPDGQALLQAADCAMYQSKGGGGNQFQFYAADLGAHADRHLYIASGLQRALQRDELLLHYQPQVDSTSGRIVGLEALLRWHPGGGAPVPPAQFIPLAEETGLIVPIGAWVLETAMRQQARLARMGHGAVRMSINMSARQFHDDVAAQVTHLVARTECDPAALTLEITEALLMRQPEAAAEAMARLAGMGVRLAIDDFGTGYSNLAALKRFPIHGLKIDRSFVAEAARGGDDAAIVGAVVALAQALHLDVIAEGVEDDDQRRFLEARGCRLMQGNLFGRPLPAADIEALLGGRHTGAQP
jgi:diguanylate cyclase (GGDEF)-like protein/PAS domain S-box-containing protein